MGTLARQRDSGGNDRMSNAATILGRRRALRQAGLAAMAVALAGALRPDGLVPAALAQGRSFGTPAPKPPVVWDKRLSGGRVVFEPSWDYALTQDPAKGETHVARLTRPADGVEAVIFACDRDGPRLDIVLTQPALALGEPERDGKVLLTLEAVCRLCGAPIDRLPNAPRGSFNYNASTRAQVVTRNERAALVRVSDASLAQFAKVFARETHFAMLGLGASTRAIFLDSNDFRVIYEIQSYTSDKALAELARHCPAWPK